MYRLIRRIKRNKGARAHLKANLEHFEYENKKQTHSRKLEKRIRIHATLECQSMPISLLKACRMARV
jgi:hypothetical protein